VEPNPHFLVDVMDYSLSNLVLVVVVLIYGRKDDNINYYIIDLLVCLPVNAMSANGRTAC
jgi:hypothetical protein